MHVPRPHPGGVARPQVQSGRADGPQVHTASRTLLTWFARLALVAALTVSVGGFTYPDGVQFLNPILCDRGLELDVQTKDPGTPFDNRPICDSDRRMTEADQRIAIVSATFVLLAAIAYIIRNRLKPRAFSAPRLPQQS
jgi:hypothetical protein